MTPVLPLVGEELAGYSLRAIVGRGAMSTVYRAGDPRVGTTVALKVIAHDLATDDLFRLRFLHVSRVAASVNHPNVIPIYDVGPWGDLLFIAMRYVAGPDLGTVLAEQQRLDPAQALTVVGQAGRALDAAHSRGLVHRDVKPANILIEHGAGDDPDHVYVTDFGITKRLLSQTGLTPTGEFVGTIDYIAPEQIQGKRVDARADIYSLACIMYRCLTGRAPFDNTVETAVLWAHLQEQPTAPSAIRPELGSDIDDVLGRALAKGPDERYPTCRELITACREALEADPRVPVVLETEDARTDADARTDEDARTGTRSDGERAEPAARVGAPGVAAGPPHRVRASDWKRTTDRGIGRRLVGAGVVAVLVIAAALAGLALFGGGGSGARTAGGATRRGADSAGGTAAGGTATSKRSSSTTTMPANKMPASNAISQALRVTNESRTAKGLLPPASCSALGHTTVTCARPAFGATSVTFHTYPSLGALYGAYGSAIRAVAPGRLRSNFGDCTERQTDGEVSWNHNYQHPRHYSLQQSRTGRLTDDQAAGRVFCTFSNSTLHIIWTQNDGHLLGILSGAPHANTWDWWKGVHHSIDLPGSNSNMSMSS
jgi:tRNA A-37 threonylcarbamoyl transferase component Bud32